MFVHLIDATTPLQSESIKEEGKKDIKKMKRAKKGGVK
jgi:hypothetical protein